MTMIMIHRRISSQRRSSNEKGMSQLHGHVMNVDIPLQNQDAIGRRWGESLSRIANALA